jgi:hypothetical protein
MGHFHARPSAGERSGEGKCAGVYSVVFRSLRAVQIPLIPRAEFVVLRAPNFAPNPLIKRVIFVETRCDSGAGSQNSLFLCADAAASHAVARGRISYTGSSEPDRLISAIPIIDVPGTREGTSSCSKTKAPPTIR